LLVLESGKVAGIFSERDYARKVALEGKLAQDTPVRSVMTTTVIGIGKGHTIDECMALMTEKRIRHLPVLDGDHVIGIVSIGDVVKEVIQDQKFTIAQLEEYITGRR
jgi:CBS domain-containing protein